MRWSWVDRRLTIDASLLALIERHGVPLVALLIFAGELGVPTGIPAEIALLLAGSYAVHSPAGLVFSLILVAVADVLGTTTLFLVVRTGGVRLLTLVRRHHDLERPDQFARWRQRLAGHDSAAVFVGRMLPLVRMPVTIGAGLLRLPPRTFLLGAAPAGALWAGAPVALGYALRADVQGFAERYTRLTHIMLIVSPALGLVGVAAWWIRRGGTAWSRLRRGRSLLGIIAAAGTVAYVVQTMWQNEWAKDRVHVTLPAPLWQVWLAALGLLAVALVAVALVDLHTSFGAGGDHRFGSDPAVSEATITAVWIVLLVVVGTIVATIEFRNPLL